MKNAKAARQAENIKFARKYLMNSTRKAPEGYPNLRPCEPWQPGESGNPAGKSKGTKDGVIVKLRRLLKAELPDGLFVDAAFRKITRGKSYGSALAAVLVFKALDEGEKCLQALEMILKYVGEESTDQELIVLLPADLNDGYAKSVADKMKQETEDVREE